MQHTVSMERKALCSCFENKLQPEEQNSGCSSIAQKENTVDKTGSHDGNGHYVRKAGAGYGNGSASDASYGYNAPRVHTHHIFETVSSFV